MCSFPRSYLFNALDDKEQKGVYKIAAAIIGLCGGHQVLLVSERERHSDWVPLTLTLPWSIVLSVLGNSGERRSENNVS